MSSQFFDIMKLLESRQIHFYVRRSSPYAIMLHVTLIGKRIEINFSEDDTVDVSVFRGSEDVETGMDAVLKALEEDE